MLLSRDYVGHMAKEVIKRLVAGKMIEVKHLENVTTQVRQVMAEEVTIEDRINEEVREILAKYAEEMRTGRLLPGNVQKSERPARSRKETHSPLICDSAAKKPSVFLIAFSIFWFPARMSISSRTAIPSATKSSIFLPRS